MDKSIQNVVVLVLLSLALMSTQVHGDVYVKAAILQSAVEKGAACLDGSPPAYFYLEGFGSGSSNWIVYIQGGGWCDSKHDCLQRSRSFWGSTSRMLSNYTSFSGILDTNHTFNPDFYNWHKVYIYYCDGSSFMSDVEEVDPETNVTYRGARIFNVMMEEMLGKGMGNAQNAILTGTSAGGLATILHCDNFRALLPNTSRVKCISDSGFFIHGKDLPGVHEVRENRFATVVSIHELANSLPTSCTSKMNPNLCLFPEYLVGDIQTPLFMIESAFDTFQIGDNLVPAVGGKDAWRNCTKNLRCNSTELGIMRDFRRAFIQTLQNLDNSTSRGMFVHSCYRHGHILAKEAWMCSSVAGDNVLANKTIGQAVGDWYFDRSSFRKMDTQNDSPRDCSTQGIDQKCLATLPHNGSRCNS